jgi:2-hydroxychromene-2-carboxylate isomerase
VDLRGFDAFAKTIPFTAAKLAYTIVDLRRCAADLGIELRVPNSFPINGLYALRGAIAATRAGRFAADHQAMCTAFGLPTFFVGAEMFWSHDRIDQVAREATRAGGA